MDTIDVELQYCLECGDEYRAEIEECAVCGKKLIPGAMLLDVLQQQKATQNTTAEISDNDELVTLQAGSLLDMKKLKRVLQQAAVPAVITAEKNCRGGCCGPQVMLQIRSQDIDRASQVLSVEYAETTRLHDYDSSAGEVVFDSSAAEAACPACGHVFIPNGPECPECGLCFG